MLIVAEFEREEVMMHKLGICRNCCFSEGCTEKYNCAMKDR